MIRIILLVFAVGQVAALDIMTFRTTLRDKCIPQPSEWKPKSAASVENFIYMIEKLENNLGLSTEQLVRMLLLRYSCNGLKHENSVWNREQTAETLEQIVDLFLDENSDKSDIPEDEKCQMLYMLSQGIQGTTEAGYQDLDKLFEHGVLSLDGDKERAIDISKVLHGVLAGFTKKEKSIEDFKVKIPDEYKGKKLNSLFSFTISELITSIAYKNRKIDEDYSDGGKWTSTLCTKEYILGKKDIVQPTVAQMIGAIDGFILGSKIHKMSEKNVKLSQILRMYYSREGFKDSLGDQSVVSHCRRNENYINIRLPEELRSQSYNYMTVFTQMIKDFRVDEQHIDDAVRNFEAKLNNIVQKTKAEEVACYKEMAKDICETPSNVFVVLDKRSEANHTMQKFIVGELIDEMNIGVDEDTISIYLNSVINMELEEIVNASDSKSNAGCTLDNYHENQIPQVAADSEVLSEIKNKLNIYEKEQRFQPGVPAKVVVYFNFGDGSNVDSNLEDVGRKLRTEHPYTTVIPIGVSKDYLGKYFSNRQPVRVLLWNTTNLAAELKERVCNAPAVLQYRDCNPKSTLESTKYTGYVTENHVQYWMMEPKDFEKSFHYKFMFKTDNGKIKVCFSRDGPISDFSDSQCSLSENGVVAFSSRDPCKDRTVHTCNPFYFSVFGREDAEKPNDRCFDDKTGGCKRLDQIKYTVQHEGLSCNGAIKLISTPVFQTLLAFFITFYIFLQQK